ncbi:MAG: hypothetical protein AABW50_03115 [Nanoarchaeota archaeon]
MATGKIIYEPIPSDLLETLEELKKHPRSLRLASEFVDAGINLMRENGLYHPFIYYQTQLKYDPQDDSGLAILTYRVISKIRKRDRMFLTFPSPEEVKIFEVYRSGSWLNPFNGISPYGFGIHLLNQDGTPKELSTYHSLQGPFT